jgi:hypothetical protein
MTLRLTLAHGFEFVATLSDELVFVDGGGVWGGGGVVL